VPSSSVLSRYGRGCVFTAFAQALELAEGFAWGGICYGLDRALDPDHPLGNDVAGEQKRSEGDDHDGGADLDAAQR
jgi:hypothetical protein